MARATIRDVAAHAQMSVSTVNRAIHEPDKVRQDTLKMVLDAAQAVGFYGIASLRHGLSAKRPKVRIGILLLQRSRVLYKNLAQALETAASAVQHHDIRLEIDYVDELTPQNVSAGLLRLAETADLVAVVAPEHPIIAATIEQLAARGVKTFALISQLTARCNVGYVGLDAWKVGRTAGWAFDTICKQPGKIGILVGNHRYRCQETNESGFRSYFREHARGFELLEARATFETASIAQEVSELLLAEHPDLVGLYVSGGGISGALAALRNSGRGREIVTVGYDLTEITRAGLLDGTINLLISHPLRQLAEDTINAMTRCFDGGADFPPQSISLAFEIHTPENI
jgi:LacI family transcriptional regulator